MVFIPNENQPSRTTQHCREVFGNIVNRVFASTRTFVVEEFWTAARSQQNDMAAIFFVNIWRRIIIPALTEAKAYILEEEVYEFFGKFFKEQVKTNGETHILNYAEIWMRALSNDFERADLEMFRHLREDAEQEEAWAEADVEGKAKIERQDMLVKLIRLAFLSTSKLPDSPHLRDRLLTSFQKDLKHLCDVLLPKAKLKTSVAELLKLIPDQVPVIRNKSWALDLINKPVVVQQPIHTPPPAEEEEIIDLVEEFITQTVETVQVKDVQVGASSEVVITPEDVQISSKGLLTAIKRVRFLGEDKADDYVKDLRDLFFKILQQVSEQGGFSALGGLRVHVYELTQKMAPRIANRDKKSWGINEFKSDAIVTALRLLEAKLSELMPSTFHNKDTCTIRGLDD